MNPEIEKLNTKIDELEKQIKLIYSASTIPFDVEQALRTRLRNLFVNLPLQLFDAPLASITEPTGGGTADVKARASIVTIITRLEDLGLISPN